MPSIDPQELLQRAMAERKAALADLEKKREAIDAEYASKVRLIQWATSSSNSGAQELKVLGQVGPLADVPNAKNDRELAANVIATAIADLPPQFQLRDVLRQANGTPRPIVKAVVAKMVRENRILIVSTGKGKRGNTYRKGPPTINEHAGT